MRIFVQKKKKENVYFICLCSLGLYFQDCYLVSFERACSIFICYAYCNTLFSILCAYVSDIRYFQCQWSIHFYKKKQVMLMCHTEPASYVQFINLWVFLFQRRTLILLVKQKLTMLRSRLYNLGDSRSYEWKLERS